VRVFLDTNVIVSALATRGLCADLVQIVLADHDLLVGETVIGEVRRVLSRKMRVPASTVAEVESFLRRELLELPSTQLRIVSPRGFWELLRA
jgi:predicted nucleic acid-binding protein